VVHVQVARHRARRELASMDSNLSSICRIAISFLYCTKQAFVDNAKHIRCVSARPRRHLHAF
jgi:hypothetical protein